MSEISRRIMMGAAASILLASAGCDREPNDWSAAQHENSIAAYERYVTDHPDGAHATEASRTLQTLRAKRAWQNAVQDGSLDAYTAFLEGHADSEFAAVAHARREALQLDPTINISMSMQTPPGVYMQSDPSGRVAGYPNGTELTVTLRAISTGNPVQATLTGTFSEMKNDQALFTNEAGGCLAVSPLSYFAPPRVTPCAEGDPPLPADDSPEALLVYAWQWLEERERERQDTAEPQAE